MLSANDHPLAEVVMPLSLLQVRGYPCRAPPRSGGRVATVPCQTDVLRALRVSFHFGLTLPRSCLSWFALAFVHVASLVLFVPLVFCSLRDPGTIRLRWMVGLRVSPCLRHPRHLYYTPLKACFLDKFFCH